MQPNDGQESVPHFYQYFGESKAGHKSIAAAFQIEQTI